MPLIPFQGREAEGDDVSFTPVKEDWNLYQLHDGSEVRMRTVVSEIFKVRGEFDREGNPVYVVRSSNVMVVKAPDNLRGDPNVG